MNPRSPLPLCLVLACLPVAATIADTAVYLDTLLDVQSLALSTRTQASSSFAAPDIAAWNLNNHVGTAAIGSNYGTILPEYHGARSTFDQTPLADATLRTYVQSTGWYYTSNRNTVKSTVQIFNQIQVENTTNQPFRAVLFHKTHGFIASGGNANSTTAFATESLRVGPIFGGINYSGSASVLFSGSPFDAPQTTVLDDWAGFTTPTTYIDPNYSAYGNLYALELTRTYIIPVKEVPAHTTTTFDVSFIGEYSAISDSSSTYGAGIVDFSGTGDFEYYAVDPTTGDRVPGVTFTLVGGTVPEPAAVPALLLMLPLLRRRRRWNSNTGTSKRP